MENQKIRINKYLAQIGIASRRKIDHLIIEGRIKVNGKVLDYQGLKINPKTDQILVDDQPIKKADDLVYIMLNKPKNIISSAADEYGRETVVSWVHYKSRIFPVGRLDRFSSGLILLTNDGDMALKLTHSKFLVPQTYHVRIYGQVLPDQIDRMERGVRLKLFTTSPAKVKVLESSDKITLLEITLKEGKNREIRRMCGKLGLEVVNLDRVAFGSLTLGDLKIGEYRDLNKTEIKLLKG